MVVDEKSEVVALEEVMHQFLLLSERFAEERQLLNKQTVELTKVLTRLSLQVEKLGEADRHLRDQVESSIKSASNHLADRAMKEMGGSLHQVTGQLAEKVQSATRTLMQYENEVVTFGWKWIGTMVFTAILTSLLLVWFLMPRPTLPLTQQQLSDLNQGEITRLIWPKLSSKEKQHWQQLVNEI